MDTYQVKHVKHDLSIEMQIIKDEIWNIDEEKEEKMSQKSLISNQEDRIRKKTLRSKKKYFTILDEGKKYDINSFST